MSAALLLAAGPVVGLFDAFTVVVAAISYGIGRKRGLVWQLSGVATLLIGGACATILARPVGALFAEGIVGRFAGWVTVYALVATCLYVLSLKLKHRIEKLEFDELDQRFGGLLGVFKGLFAFGVLTLVAAGLSTGVALSVRESASGRALLAIVDEVRPAVPDQVAQALFPSSESPAKTADTTSPSPPNDPVYRAPFGSAAPAPAPRPSPSGQPMDGASEPKRVPPPEPVPFGPQPLPESEPAPAPALESRRAETREADRAFADPFDTSQDPVDPLAPPR